MTDLNTAICKARGWTNISVLKNGETCATSPDGCFYCPAPDFEHDANLYMTLYFELHKDERMRLATVDKNNLGTAICQAYCKLKGIEVVG